MSDAIGLSESKRVLPGGASDDPLLRQGGLRSPHKKPGRGVRDEFYRYIVAGGFAFVCDAGTLYSLTQYLHINYLISAAVGFTLGTVVNYLLSRTWVFERRTLQNTSAEITIFTLIGAGGLGLNELILWFFQAKLGIFYLYAKGVSGVTVFMWNFGARKLALFR